MNEENLIWYNGLNRIHQRVAKKWLQQAEQWKVHNKWSFGDIPTHMIEVGLIKTHKAFTAPNDVMLDLTEDGEAFLEWVLL